MTPRLKREVGLWGAVLLGLGSILGTGVFVSIGIAADVAGPAVVLAVVLAAVVAACNALSSAQLAASHPVSGGSYEYGYLHVAPAVGFSAGWMFLLAKSASAAAAALGFSAYLLNTAGVTDRDRQWCSHGGRAVGCGWCDRAGDWRNAAVEHSQRCRGFDHAGGSGCVRPGGPAAASGLRRRKPYVVAWARRGPLFTPRLSCSWRIRVTAEWPHWVRKYGIRTVTSRGRS